MKKSIALGIGACLLLAPALSCALRARLPIYDVDAPSGPLRALAETPEALLAAAPGPDWDIFLGPPMSSDSLEVLLNPESQPVFSFPTVDGEPVIRVDGKRWGALTSRFEVENFELTGEFRWGQAVYAAPGFRDSGIMFHSFGIFGAVSKGGGELAPVRGHGHFMDSIEYQVASGDIGNAHRLGLVNFRALWHRSSEGVEHPVGEWNSVRIQAVGSSARLYLNDVLMTEIVSATRTDRGTPLARGKIQLQSEGSEIYFRRLKIRSLSQFP